MTTIPGRRFSWRPSGPNGPRAFVASRAFAVVGVALLIANLTWVIVFVFLRAGAPFSPLWDGWIGNLAMLVPIGACFARALRGGPRRGAALWLGAGMICWAAGNAIFLVWTQFQVKPPAPGPS